MNHLLTLGLLTVAILSTVSSPQIDAAIYKWKDAQGQIHYSATAPSHVEKENIQKKINQASHLPTPPEGKTAESTSTNTVDDNTATTENKSASNSEYCKQQKSIVVALEKNEFVKWKIDNKETLLEGEAKKAKVKEVKQDIEKYCSSSPTK